jgi:hypothetical protein
METTQQLCEIIDEFVRQRDAARDERDSIKALRDRNVDELTDAKSRCITLYNALSNLATVVGSKRPEAEIKAATENAWHVIGQSGYHAGLAPGHH